MTSETFLVGLLAGAGLTVPGLHVGLLAGARSTIPGLCQGGKHANQAGPCIHGSGRHVSWETRGSDVGGCLPDRIHIVEQANEVGVILPGRARWHGLRLECRHRVGSLDLWSSSHYQHTNGHRARALFVVLGLVFLWFAITREHHSPRELRPNVM
jgi:hypothetical protein